jgi:TOBE domain
VERACARRTSTRDRGCGERCAGPLLGLASASRRPRRSTREALDPQPARRHRHVGHQRRGDGRGEDPPRRRPEITSSITKEAAEDLGLAEGSKVTALIKSTEVALAVE